MRRRLLDLLVLRVLLRWLIHPKMSLKKKQRDLDRSKSFTDRKATNDQTPTAGSLTKSLRDDINQTSFKKLSFVISVAFVCCCIYFILIFFTSFRCHQPSNADTPLLANYTSHKSNKPNNSLNKQSDLLSDAATSLSARSSTGLDHIVFGIAASARLWEKRKEYVKCWWRSEQMRGFVWLDRAVNKTSSGLPPLRVSADTSKFNYTSKKGNRAAIRISRIVSETFRVGLPDVHWFVMGDDDTVFIPENLLRVLSKYDWRKFYYIGSVSESHIQNTQFSYNMAYGGGGFAISYPLAKQLHKTQDICLHRYPYLFGSDDRMQACMAELGVPLTREYGFHQFDIYGDAFGLLAAHPITPLLSLHHLDIIDPIFPNMTRLQAIQQLVRFSQVDPGSLLQQSICYDKHRNWSFSISSGYAVQVYRGLLPPRELERPARTFISWYKRTEELGYPFSTRPAAINACQKPVVFYIKKMGFREDGRVEGNYTSEVRRRGNCRWKMASPAGFESITVVKEQTDELWYEAPRRQCCQVVKAKDRNMEIQVTSCGSGNN